MEVQNPSSYSQISTYARKAWYTACVLLSLGRPACPAEIAEKLSFLRWSPEFVEFLCCIPNSPLVLTGNGLVALSSVALVALGRYVASLMLRVGIGGSTVPMRLGENASRKYYRKRKRLGRVADPVMKKIRSDSRLLGEGEGKDEVPDMDWLIKGNLFQSYVDLCAPTNSILNVPKFPAGASTFRWGSFSDKMFVDPLKLNYRQPTMNIEYKEDKIEQNAPSVDHISLEETEHVFLDSCMHHFRRVKQLKAHPYLVPSSSSPRADSLLLEGICTKDFLSNIGNYALSCMGTDDSCHPNIGESPSVIKAVEDYGNVGTELENSCDVPERNIKPPTSLYDVSEKAASFKKDLHKESMNDSKKKMVAEAAVRKSSFKAIQNKQDVLTQRPKGLFKVTEKKDVLPEEKHLRGPSAGPLKKKVKQIPKNNNSNQEKCGSFCFNSSKGKSPAKTINHQQDVLARKVDEPSKEQIDDVPLDGKCREGSNAFPIKNITKQIPSSKMSIQEKNGSFHLGSSKDHLDSKVMPKFDMYIVEDEEGSGGYGTVYRARRKSDGAKFAIKYPHPNANMQHIVNERKMLERFGGKDFVIKYEGSCKSDNSDCFVLKHVEHDRTDALRKDINISELQWYGYCMFTALRSLHKQGVVHRDVKPGNFLFSRKTCLGYIIDFNLAKDLYPKQANTGSYLKTVSPSKQRKILDTKAPELAPGGLKRGFKPQELKLLRNKVADATHRNFTASQGADGSGLTSAKDLTSTKTPSAERLREPLPCLGRKELINLAQEAMQIPEQEVAGVPSYKRKRIAAPSAPMGKKQTYTTPMPIHCPGSGFLKEGGKKKKEGSCSGTKGFRAPEVLLRSVHQGSKLDVWSAGVTLLYLMTGRMAFTGDPEQNLKDIVKLKGSEELWEVAKIHDRESSFPKDLYVSDSLQSTTLRNWCRANTKRPEFFKAIPNSLFDLVDKCLSVNPRSRISAEDALRHEFFAPCIDAVRKRRLLKQHLS